MSGAIVDEAKQTIETYDRGAAEFAARFESITAGDEWSLFRDLISAPAGGLALDIGAGSGRDAAWLASLGFEVVAAEPAEGMRREGQGRHPGLRWLDDRLPDLSIAHGLGLSFDFIMLNAVWMHLRPTERPRAFRKMATLLKPGGVLMLTLRHGPSEPGRTMHAVTLGEIESLSRDHGLTVVRAVDQRDLLGRPGVSWTLVCLRLPDDGTMGLPLIRGVILTDEKSSTYKLGLLRAVAKIADSSPSLVRSALDHEDTVIVPLGLVALNWIRGYLPLVAAGMPQTPNNRGPDGLGFAKEGFRGLIFLGVTAQDLRIGAFISGERAAALIAALQESRRTIVNMPARYTTLPNSQDPVFNPRPRKPIGKSAALTAEWLWSWGELSVPGPLWRTMVRLGAWIEPVLVAEWSRLMRSYAVRMGVDLKPGEAEARLVWQEPLRDTTLARSVAKRLQAEGSPIYCVWSGAKLTSDNLDIDHTLPWSAWPCGDLWNLAPALRRVNQHQKRDRLPTSGALAGAREPILRWWSEAWIRDPTLETRFKAEASAALPVDGNNSPDAVFAGLEWRRLRVQQDQQAPEWPGLRGPTHPLL